MGKSKDLQFVWPKDGPKGKSGHRGFFGRLDNILTGRGPDIFLQRKGSSRPIQPEWWGNWDSWRDPVCHILEDVGSYNGLWSASRDFQRYDPQSRQYTEWAIPEDWNGNRIGPDGRGIYPRFTHDEWSKMRRNLLRGRPVHPHRMGEDWHHNGPKRFDYEHDFFWRNAHRLAENYREGIPRDSGLNPYFTMHQNWHDDLNHWMRQERLY